MHVGVRYHYYLCNFYFSPIITIPQDRGAGAGGQGELLWDKLSEYVVITIITNKYIKMHECGKLL